MNDMENRPTPIREVVLELLRPGPPHNQLLSPLTPYLALCSSHSAEVVHVPFEHWELQRRLQELGYRTSDRPGAIQEIAKTMGEIMGRVGGLGTELQANGGDAQPFVHLRLIISASELALLPWEIASAAKGFPGEGSPLSLQTVAPLCLTREVRRPPGTQQRWPTDARILFAYAAPGDSEVPFEAHLYALRRAIDPWVEPYDTNDSKQRQKALGEHLEVLPNATLRDIQEACARTRFTHVHILAHGRETGEGERRRYGLAFHSQTSAGQPDVVEGERLAAALISQPKENDGSPWHPAVVTVASCESGNQGSVVYPGGSLAHDLHRAGIPLVVGSQFPLSFAGSVSMAEILYERLLWGEDPRLALRDLRAQLRALYPATHDWASIVAYVALPRDLARQLAEVQCERSLGALRLSMKHADDALNISGRQDNLAIALKRVQRALNRVPEIPGREAETLCHKGARLKRWGQVIFQRWELERVTGNSISRSVAPGANPSAVEKSRPEEYAKLEEALESYRRAFKSTSAQDWKNIHWGGTQFLSLSAVLGKRVDAADWNLCVAICEREVGDGSRIRSV
ncbi:MAG: CHAT domain-containing protein, partial [Thermoanaerobaculia bacterium]|nr:CHAT domain-containing protein [Thermoanaerobaculia bacterium]